MTIADRIADGTLVQDAHVETSVYARVLAEDVAAEGKTVIARPAPTSVTS